MHSNSNCINNISLILVAKVTVRCSIFSFLCSVVFYRSLFVLSSFLFWPLRLPPRWSTLLEFGIISREWVMLFYVKMNINFSHIMTRKSFTWTFPVWIDNTYIYLSLFDLYFMAIQIATVITNNTHAPPTAPSINGDNPFFGPVINLIKSFQIL